MTKIWDVRESLYPRNLIFTIRVRESLSPRKFVPAKLSTLKVVEIHCSICLVEIYPNEVETTPGGYELRQAKFYCFTIRNCLYRESP